MRLLLTTDFYHPFIGGAERQMQLLAESIKQYLHVLYDRVALGLFVEGVFDRGLDFVL